MTSLTLVETFFRDDPSRLRHRYYTDEHNNIHGLHHSWHFNGQLWIQCEYVNGNIHGLCQYWHENGQLRAQCEYVNDKRHGLYEKWDDVGICKYRRWYDKGIILVRVEYSNKVSIELSRDQSIESGVFLSRVISSLVEGGIEYDITYFG
jgi:antitoxin component YwqK of YwqJK toxin-antitoxin module